MNSFMLYPNPGLVSRMKEFLEQGIIAEGWAATRDLTKKNKDEIKQILADTFHYKGQALGNKYSAVNILVNEMSVGDIVLVPYGDTIHIARVSSDYFYNENCAADDYAHQRKVVWEKSIPRSSLPEAIRASLRYRGTAANLTKHNDLILQILESKDVPIEKVRMITSRISIRPDLAIEIAVPDNMSRLEARKLGDAVATLYYQE